MGKQDSAVFSNYLNPPVRRYCQVVCNLVRSVFFFFISVKKDLRLSLGRD